MVSDDHRHLVHRIGLGDEGALGELYDQCAGLVYRIAGRLTGSPVGAEDVTMAVFMQVWRSPETLDRHEVRVPEHLACIARRYAVRWCRVRAMSRSTSAADPQDEYRYR